MRALLWAVAAVLFTTPMHADCASIVAEMGSTKPVCTSEYPELFVKTSEPVREIKWRFAAPSYYMFEFEYWNLHNLTPTPYWPGGRAYSADIEFVNGCKRSMSIDIENIPEIGSTFWYVPARLCDGSAFGLDAFPVIYPLRDLSPVWELLEYHGPLEWSATNATLRTGQGRRAVVFDLPSGSGGDTPVQVEISVKAPISRHCASTKVRVPLYRSPAQRTIATAPNICPNTPQMASVEQVDGDTYEWSIENGTITSSGSDSTITFMANAVGQTRLSLKTSRNACDRAAEITIPVSLPSASIDSAILPTCAGTPVDIAVTLTGAAPFTLRWSDGLTEIVGSTTHSRTVAPETSERYEIVEVTGSGGASCDGTATGAIDVQVSARPQIVDEPKNVTIRNNEKATLSVGAVGDAITFQWYEGASGDTSHPISGGIQRVLTVTPSQTTRYWADVRSHCGTVFSKAANVAVTNAPGRRRAAR